MAEKNKKSSRLLTIHPSDLIQVKVMGDVLFLDKPVALGCEYTPIPNEKSTWKLDFEIDQPDAGGA